MKILVSFLSALIIFTFTACSQKVMNTAPMEPIRGSWITNVASSILSSRDSIKAGVKLCKENGLNHIFVVETLPETGDWRRRVYSPTASEDWRLETSCLYI